MAGVSDLNALHCLLECGARRNALQVRLIASLGGNGGALDYVILWFIKLVRNSLSHTVFAYGSNMCSGRFRDYNIHPEGAGRSAFLAGYRLLFNKPSRDNSGKANVEKYEGSGVWGVRYFIPDTDLDVLDEGEVGYHRVQLPVTTPDGEQDEAWVYLASCPSDDVQLRPYTWYKRFLVEGAREHSLPADYIAMLESIDAMQDADQRRDRRNRTLECQTG